MLFFFSLLFFFWFLEGWILGFLFLDLVKDGNCKGEMESLGKPFSLDEAI